MNERYSEEVRRYLLWRYAVPELRVLADARKLKNLKLWACHYALDNRHSRGCEPGEGCTRRTESYRKRVAFKHDGSTEEITSR